LNGVVRNVAKRMKRILSRWSCC